MARRFGLRNHASFESHLKQLQQLATLVAWRGDQGAIRFKRHPGEDLLLNAVALHQDAAEHVLLAVGEEQGYLPGEVHYLLELLLIRGQLQRDKQRNCYVPAQTLAAAELKILADEIKSEAVQLSSVAGLPELQAIVEQADRVITGSDSDDLAEIQVRLLQAQRALQQARPAVVKKVQNELIQLRGKLYEQKDTLSRPLTLSHTGLALDTHIYGAQRILTTRCEAGSRAIAKQLDEIAGFLQHPVEVANYGVLQKWLTSFTTIRARSIEQHQQLEELLSLYHRHDAWVQLVARLQKIAEHIGILREFTDVTGFEREYNQVLTVAMESLAVEGLAHYHSLFNMLTPRVNQLSSEINTALQAQHLKQSRNREAEPGTGMPIGASVDEYLASGDSVQTETRPALLTLAREPGMNLTKLAQRAGLPPQQLQVLLLTLEAAGMLQITFTVSSVQTDQETAPELARDVPH